MKKPACNSNKALYNSSDTTQEATVVIKSVSMFCLRYFRVTMTKIVKKTKKQFRLRYTPFKNHNAT